MPKEQSYPFPNHLQPHHQKVPKLFTTTPYTTMNSCTQNKNTNNCSSSPNKTNALMTTFTPSSTTTFVQTPFFFFKPHNNTLQFPVVVVDVFHNFQKSVTSATHNCLQFLHFSASHHPFFSKFLSLSSKFQEFSQVHLRSYRNLDSLSSHNFAAVLPGDSVAGVVVANGVLNFLNLYNTILVCRLVLTWFPQAPQQIVSPLSTLCDPYLNIFRGIIPPLGGTLDLSPILAFLVLNAFTSAASALPAEIPSAGGVSQPGLSDLTSAQKKWQRRLQGSKSSNSDSPK